MDHLQALRQHIRQYLLIAILLDNIILMGLWWAGLQLTPLSPLSLAIISFSVSAILSACIVYITANLVTEPVQALWQAILHLSPGEQGVTAVQTNKLRVGRELVTNLIGQLNQLTNVAQQVAARTEADSRSIGQNFVAQNLPLAFIALDSTENIIYLNSSAEKYLGVKSSDMAGKSVYAILDMAFPDKDTFDSWLKDVKTKQATASKTWERVRLNVRTYRFLAVRV